MISIITPVFNCEKYINETFESVISQTFSDWEWIIVNDCSTDHTLEIIEGFVKRDNRIRVFSNEKNSGSAYSRNHALNEAKGKYITFLDADDKLLPNYLESQFAYILSNGPIITAGYKRETGKTDSVFMPRKTITYKTILYGNDLSCLTTMYDRETIGDMFFPEDLKYNEDYVFWTNILKKGYVVKTNENVLAIYRIVKTSKNSKKMRLIKINYHIYRKYLHFNPFKSMWCVLRWALYGLKKYRNVK